MSATRPHSITILRAVLRWLTKRPGVRSLMLCAALLLSLLSLCGTVACNRSESGPDKEIAAFTRAGDAAKREARYTEALAAYQKALELSDKDSDPKRWTILAMNVASMLKQRAAWQEAEPLYTEILRLREEHYGKESPETATALNNLATLLQATNRLAEAEPLLQRALAIWETSLGKDHPDVAGALNNLAQLLKETNRLKEAEPLMRRALAIDEVSFGRDHPKVTGELSNLAQLL